MIGNYRMEGRITFITFRIDFKFSLRFFELYYLKAKYFKSPMQLSATFDIAKMIEHEAGPPFTTGNSSLHNAFV